MGHHHYGGAFRVYIFEYVHDRLGVLLSKFPVGSSARITKGLFIKALAVKGEVETKPYVDHAWPLFPL